MAEHDRLLARLAELQAGHVSTRQLAALGIGARAVEHRVRAGRLVPVDKGVHRIAGAPSTWEGDVVAAALRFGPSAAVSHWSAAVLLGLDVARRDPPVEVVVRRSDRDRRSRLVRVHSTRRLDRLDLTWVDRLDEDAVAASGLPPGLHPVRRIRTTSAVRTIFDIAPRATAHELGNLVDSATARRLVSEAFLRRRLAAHRTNGRAGVRLLDEVLLDAGGHSWLERRFLRVVREAGLPRPRCQVVHRVGGRFVARVDFEFAPFPVIVEVSGRRGHVSEADRARDARRRNALQRQQYIVLEFVTADVIDAPHTVVATIAAALADSGRTSPRAARANVDQKRR